VIRKFENRKQKSEVKILSQSGIALLMVLWVLVLLSIIALNFVNSNRWNTVSTRNLKEETVSYYLAVSGYHEAVNYLLSDKDPSFDFLDSDGNFWIDKETQPVTGEKTTDDGTIEIKIIDENARININLANTERLKKLLEHVGVQEDSITEIIDSMLDWKDSGDKDAHRLSGAESEYYESLEDPYMAKNAFFDVPEELLLVKGMASQYMDGSFDVNSLLSLITTFNRGAVNINTVSEEVMRLLGLNDYEIEAVLKQRNVETGGFRFIPREFAAHGLNAVSSNVLRIEVTARARNSQLASKIVAIINKKVSKKGFKSQTVYWRESAENTRG
jgi:general secretion pathway protein K